MGCLHIDSKTFEIDGILFDKDGTLIDFGSIWVHWAEKFISDIASKARLSDIEVDKSALSESIGFHLNDRIWDPKGPLCIGSLADLITIMSYHLYQNGMAWNDATALVIKAHTKLEEKYQWQQEIRPITGLQQFLEQAQVKQLKLGVVTSDNHHQAIQHLKSLNIQTFFNSVIGHDQVERGKPFPDMVIKACNQLGLDPNRTLIIGDSNGDMLLGENAGLLASIGIVAEPRLTSGHLTHADHVIHHYSDLTIT